ncbi:SDR family NAD(P)-dependent oxidoreductase [Streptomyces justiciae]|uniref:SDR family NAD(P)-dependent oxidoreductase n=1 Tax=Streptomyces justiciae TaxID=2780140 RepID=UPI00187EE3DB|nr:SDR family NAD(P)-dependent oxidoreductase [Streptomyces justiciae]MBE8474610.1 SDR family oxidoreductase [Streptomyces justiciae]MCW8379005.1 SDR family oxidoreductase [Streptomyces justiciae]
METRTALVTGAAQGLGQEFAMALAGRGYRVAGLDLVPQPQTAGKVLDYLELVGDVTDEEVVEDRLERVVEQFGTLHVVVNNAGVYPSKPFEETTPDDWRRVMRVNLEAPYLVTRAALPYLKAAGWGRVVNIASAAVFTAPPTMVPYVASKMGLIGFTRALAAALAPYEITVNAIAPTMVRTATAERTVGADGGFEAVRGGQAVHRTQEPSDLVSTLLYVVDEGSAFLTGQTLNVSGGSAYL